MRIENLSHLSLERHLRWEKANCKGRLSIAIPGGEVKNGDPLHYPFPVDASNMVRDFLERFRPRLFKGQNEYLFAGRNGKPKRSDTLSKQISKRLWDLSLSKTFSADIDDANRLAMDEVFKGHR